MDWRKFTTSIIDAFSWNRSNSGADMPYTDAERESIKKLAREIHEGTKAEIKYFTESIRSLKEKNRKL